MSDRTVGRLTKLVRAAHLTLHLVKGAAMVGLVFPYLKPAERDAVVNRWCCDALTILRVRVHVRAPIPSPTTAPVLVVANHISWLDILALNAVRRVRFVAKTEVRTWPVLGWLAARTGTFFIQRNRPRQLIRLIRSVSRALDQRHCVAFFPEGTTTDGRGVLPFRSGLMQSAVLSQAVVWPVALRYTTPEGTRASSAAFVGDQSLIQSILHVLSQSTTHLQLRFAPPLEGVQTDRKKLARQAWAAIFSMLDDPQRAFAPSPRFAPIPLLHSEEPKPVA